ncbi:MAG: alpha/beta fold hydrolase [Planctomycetia bacterium]|nr:alpha/beta fold hydrolase [Planctomycetia bacterium]
MPFASLILAFSWSPAIIVVASAAAVWVLFWIYVWIRYFPIVYRLIGETPILAAEPTHKTAGGEECAFRTADGLTLRGTYLATPLAARKGVVVFCHELNGDRWNATPYVVDLVAQGYDIFTFDFRNHGASDAVPGLVPRPWLSPDEVIDLRAAIDYVASRSDTDPRGVGLFGISRGAGAAFCVAADDPRIRCVFTDGVYSAQSTHLCYFIRYVGIFIPYPWITDNLPHWIYQGFLWVGRWWWGLRNRFRFVDVDACAARIRRPVMMVHGERDSMIPVEAARALRKCVRAPAKLWIVPKAKHNGAIFAVPAEYQRRVARFFRLHLAPSTRTPAG